MSLAIRVWSERDAVWASNDGSGNCSCMIDIVLNSPFPMTTNGQKVALVTGAARRIGRAIALGLAKDGWDVAVHYGRSAADAEATVREIAALGRRAAAVQCDLADEAAVKQLLARASAA